MAQEVSGLVIHEGSQVSWYYSSKSQLPYQTWHLGAQVHGCIAQITEWNGAPICKTNPGQVCDSIALRLSHTKSSAKWLFVLSAGVLITRALIFVRYKGP